MVPPEDQEKPSRAEGETSSEPAVEEAIPSPNPYYYDDDSPSDYIDTSSEEHISPATALTPVAAAPPALPPSGGGPADEEEPEPDEDGMIRMSFFDHLEELRHRLFHAIGGLVVAFAFSLLFANALWTIVSAPAVGALKQIGVNPPVLSQIAPLETFNILYIKLPLLTSVFLASPWLLYQLWAFIAPGLYKRERRWAAPFVICTAGLFVMGGLFAYFVVFRFALVFLLGLTIGNNIVPLISVENYFDTFFNVTLGVGIVFELPVLIFFLTLIRVVTPGFLMRNIRYAILGIFALAAIVTPTPDVFNMVLFAMPMCVLFFVGILASYILVLKRENKRFPWGKVLAYTFLVLAVVAAIMYYLHVRFGYHFVRSFPWFIR